MSFYLNVTQKAANGSGIEGMDNAVRFFKYLSGSGKNAVIRKSYMLATKEYRRKLKADTPTGENRTKGKPLKNTIVAKKSKKYANKNNLIDPMIVGHSFLRGGYHLHLVVLGRKEISAKRFELDRKRRGGGTKPKKAMSFKDGGVRYTVKKVEAQKPNDFVARVFNSEKWDIQKKFADSFVKGVAFKAKRILKQYYVN